jgi:carbamoyltransferase
MNRPGEAIICTPEDALEMCFGSNQKYLIIQDVLGTRRPESAI